jgi:hypothetical protein
MGLPSRMGSPVGMGVASSLGLAPVGMGVGMASSLGLATLGMGLAPVVT